MNGTRIVRGEVVVPSEVEGVAGELVVQVEDVSRADAPSVVVAELREIGVQLESGGLIPFEVEVPADAIDEASSYSVRVHVDVSGTGRVDVGDFVSTQSHPVLTRGFGDEARVPVRRV